MANVSLIKLLTSCLFLWMKRTPTTLHFLLWALATFFMLTLTEYVCLFFCNDWLFFSFMIIYFLHFNSLLYSAHCCRVERSCRMLTTSSRRCRTSTPLHYCSSMVKQLVTWLRASGRRRRGCFRRHLTR